ncbi:MAG: hypothetical protein ACK521_00855 [bacterium]
MAKMRDQLQVSAKNNQRSQNEEFKKEIHPQMNDKKDKIQLDRRVLCILAQVGVKES